jgi:hypothetical protein
MPEITISEEAHRRLVEFKCVVETVIEDEIDLDDCAEMILEMGIDSMVEDLLGSLDSTVLLHSIQQLGAKYPMQVYQYIAETLKQGAPSEAQREMQRQLGFDVPKKKTKENA